MKIKFNYVDDFDPKVAEVVEMTQNHRMFKAIFQGLTNDRAVFFNSLGQRASELSEKYGCTLQNVSQSPPPNYKYDGKGNIIDESPVSALAVYVFHGEGCIEACEELDSYYKTLI